MKLTFDTISDIHADFYIRQNQMTEGELVKELIPSDPSPLLVIAGDISNYNDTSEKILCAFLGFYEKVLVVFGNHDLYQMNSKKRNRAKTPLDKWVELKERFATEERIVFLDGDVFEYEGVRFGGTGGWYDLSYSIHHLGSSVMEMEAIYAIEMEWDNRYIPYMNRFNWDFLDEQKRKLEELVDKVDVMVTHVPPSAAKIAEKYRHSRLSGCFFFDGADLLKKTTAKVWLCGHTHERFDFEQDGVRIINHAMGYPFEPKGSADLIRSVTVE